jgi:Zn-dependent peptidase ImmA (M78 family)
MDLGHEKLSAISIPGLNDRHLIVLNSNQSASAQRFSLAHELGHLVMHNGVSSEDMEREADAFAASLLMPRQDIETQLHSLRYRDLGALKSYWKVSLAALIYRAKALGHLTERQSRTFWIELNKLPGGRKHEQGEFPREEPRLLRNVIEHYQSDLGYSEEDLARVIVANKEPFQQKYLGKESQTLRAIGRPTLHRVSVDQ